MLKKNIYFNIYYFNIFIPFFNSFFYILILNINLCKCNSNKVFGLENFLIIIK